MFGRQGRLAYSASKHALLGITRTLAIELAKYNVAVNSVSPGYIMTKMTKKNNSVDVIKQLENNIPLQRLGKSEEVADLVYYLASESNSYLTGQNIVIDGGYSAGGFQQ
jgi:3-oxoacyl-[acyl-carrier protein] reductase